MAEGGDEFSRPMAINDLPLAGRPFAIDASPDERAALARLFGIREVRELRASGAVRPEAGGQRFRLEGSLQAEVVQTCVVTLEPVVNRVEVPLERLYGTHAGEEWDDNAGTEVYLDLSSDVLTEPLAGGVLDVGAAVAEQLALDLDPYPRAPGAEFSGLEEDRGSTPTGGLAQLARWRKGAGDTG
jgi:hypothetical protein